MTDKGIRPYMCSVCGAPGYAKGLCERDYARARRGLSPTPHALRVTTVEQAFARYARPVPSGCIEWSGNRKAHRIALERAGFTVPDPPRRQGAVMIRAILTVGIPVDTGPLASMAPTRIEEQLVHMSDPARAPHPPADDAHRG